MYDIFAYPLNKPSYNMLLRAVVGLVTRMSCTGGWCRQLKQRLWVSGERLD
jgi:hypothetical protein